MPKSSWTIGYSSLAEARKPDTTPSRPVASRMSSIHALVTQVSQDFRQTSNALSRNPQTVPPTSGTQGLNSAQTPASVSKVHVNGHAIQPKPVKFRSKYKHVEALHRVSRPSVLSHESEAAPSFVGFRNLMVLTIIVMNLRLVIENAKKYGLLITLRADISNFDLGMGALLYALTPCHLFAAYLIELVAAEHARGAVGAKKKSEATIAESREETSQAAFRRTWHRIGLAHFVNATLALGITTTVVYTAISNPGIGAISELHAIIVWLKTCSYAFTNRDLRHALLHSETPSATRLPEVYKPCPYPRNITLRNLTYFWWAPTLVYQPSYPRTPHPPRLSFILKRLGECLALSTFIWATCAQYAAPLLQNSLTGLQSFDVPSITERVLKLSTISLIVWLAGFFLLFQSFLNLLAELLQFGDREFYEDWWNSTCLRQYWSSWNKPVYHFMRRHVYSPLVGRGWSPLAASTAVFVFSGLLHELAVGVPSHRILGVAFAGMVLQLPLISATDWCGKDKDENGLGRTIGNCIFWVSFVMFGQPVGVLVYYFAWQARFGVLKDGN